MRSFVFPVSFVALVLLQALFVCAYVTHEHTFYFWDHSMYHGLARAFFDVSRGGFGDGLEALNLSFKDNYNALFALPSLLTFRLFGDGRLVFLLTLFAVFFVAFEGALAFVLRRLFDLAWGQALLLAAAACSLIPPLWTPLLEGYPDIGGTVFFTLAFGFALMPFARLRWALGVGAFLGLSFLFRRHFAYPALAFLLVKAAVDFYLYVWRADVDSGGQALKRFIFYYLLCTAGFFLAPGLLAPDFLKDALFTDYSALYLSYKRPASFFLPLALSRFGFLLFAAFIAGLFVVARRFPRARRGALLLGLTALVWAILWCLGPSQTGGHYLLHVLPLAAAVGLSGLFLEAARFPLSRWRRFAAGALFLVLAVNSAWALWFSPSRVLSPDDLSPGFFSAPRPPSVRHDYDQLVALGSYVASTTAPEDTIYAVGSSFVFNQDLMRAVYTDVLGRADVARRFVFAPEIDSSQSSALDAFASSTVFLVPGSLQYHLDPSGQKVVTSVAEQFPPPSSRADLFRADDRVFSLENGVTVRVWRRSPWRPLALHEALADIRKVSGNAHQDWVALTKGAPLFISTDARAATTVVANFDVPYPSLPLFFDVPLAAGAYRLDVRVEAAPACRDPVFTLAALTGTGRILWEKRFAPVVVPGEVSSFFDLPAAGGPEMFLRLNFKVSPFQPCGARLTGLAVSKA